MSRKVKNIIMITIIIIVCIASGFTIKLAKESGEEKNQGNPPQMLNSSGENNSNGQIGTPPNGMGVIHKCKIIRVEIIKEHNQVSQMNQMEIIQ